MAERDDLRLTQDVQDELARSVVGSDHIVVTVHDGAVTLTGQVPTYAEKVVADEAAGRVAGVRAIANELTVRISDEQRRDDPDLAEAAAHALRWNAAVPDIVRVSAKGGWITLEGDVMWHHERLAAERAIAMLIGVSGITNHIRVRPQPQSLAADIQSDITHALRRSGFVDERHIGVHVRDSHVTLRGTARSWVERAEAERLAWIAGGVTAVDNQITVGIPTQPDEWAPVLDRIEGSGVLPPDVGPDDAARAVLCAVSQRMSRDEAYALAGTLPGELSRLLHPCVRHRHDAPDAVDGAEFLRRIADHLLVTPEQAELIARAVFAALKHRVPLGDIQEVATRLPGDLKELWRVAA
jgi:osmotically-inducible protein OsmY/uncharacterized protein (DUF2267 family)